MIRVFNHYLHAWTLKRILFDFGFALLALAVVVLVQVKSLSPLMPMAVPQVFSLAAGLFVINTASGLYQLSQNRSLAESCLRAALALVLGLALTHQLFRMLPAEIAEGEAVRLSAMLVITIVIVRRVFVGHWAGSARANSRVLIFGTGPGRRWWAARSRASTRWPASSAISRGPTRSRPPCPRPSACRARAR